MAPVGCSLSPGLSPQLMCFMGFFTVFIRVFQPSMGAGLAAFPGTAVGLVLVSPWLVTSVTMTAQTLADSSGIVTPQSCSCTSVGKANSSSRNSGWDWVINATESCKPEPATLKCFNSSPPHPAHLLCSALSCSDELAHGGREGGKQGRRLRSHREFSAGNSHPHLPNPHTLQLPRPFPLHLPCLPGYFSQVEFLVSHHCHILTK